MSDYIKREYAIDILTEFKGEAGNLGNTEIEGTCMLARNEIINLPSADVEEVVHCKDCKHWWEENELCVCDKCCDGTVACVEAPPEHYCSYGDLKDD